MFPSRSVRLILGGVLLLVHLPASAQTTACKTANCAAGNPGGPLLPAECKATASQTIASPRIITITMNGTNFRFEPANPRIEGRHTTPGLQWDYQCIQWHKMGAAPWHSATEVTAGNTCLDQDPCTSTNTYPNPCAFETGNIDAASLEWGTCHYQQIAPGSYPYKCRLHDTFGMVGTLTVVPPLILHVTRGAGDDVVLQWPTGGSAAGPWDVFRATQAPMVAPTRLSPAAGTAARGFTDATPPAGNVFYMIRECNIQAGACI